MSDDEKEELRKHLNWVFSDILAYQGKNEAGGYDDDVTSLLLSIRDVEYLAELTKGAEHGSD